MAGIDKTYTDSYKEYKEFKDWADAQYLTFFDGYKVCIGDWVWDLVEADFSRERSIMNSPTWLDIYLIQNCKSSFVLDRMQDVYSEEDYELFKTIKLTEKPSIDFQQNRKVTITRSHRTRFPLHSKPYSNKVWWLQSNSNFDYNNETKRWVINTEYYPTNTNTSHPKSLKALVRHIRKQYLPKGVEFSLSGRYVGEEYIVKVM